MADANAQLDTFPKLLVRNSLKYRDRPAIREKRWGIWNTLTWRDLAEEVASLAAALAERGVAEGVHVALLGENRPRLLCAICAVQSLGATAMPLYQEASANEIAPMMKLAQATHVFAQNQEQVDKVLEILPQCPSIQHIFYDEERGMRHYKQPQLESCEALLSVGRKTADKSADYLQELVNRTKGGGSAFLFFTAGTSGTPKGVILTHCALIDRASVMAVKEGVKDTGVSLAYLSPGWFCQNLFSYVLPLVAGYCVCCPESSDTVLADMREIAPSYLLVTPRILDSISSQVNIRMEGAGGINLALYRQGLEISRRIEQRVQSGKRAGFGIRFVRKIYDVLIYGPLRDVLGMSKLQVVFTAGDAIDPDMLMYFRSLGINLKQAYGTTETGFFVTMQGDENVKPDTVGPAADGVELSISPQSEVLVRSAGLFQEYLCDPEATKRVVNADGWFHTGDIGTFGVDGQLRIIDRMSDVGVMSDGTRFVPRQLENKIRFSPYVKEALVFGGGRDSVCAFIDIDTVAVGRWADTHDIPYMGHADLASQDAVYVLIGEYLSEVNAELASDPELATCQIHRFLLLPEEFNADDGLLTRTGKVRRLAIGERYSTLVDALYSSKTDVPFDTGIEIEHVGDTGDEKPAGLKIRDAYVVNGGKQIRRVA